MSVLVPPPATVREDPQALIKEARRRTRRRRLRAALGAVLLAGAALVAFFASSGGSSGIVAETAGRPFVNVRAFSRDGELAFISRGALWVLDGPAGSLRKVASTTFTKGSQSVGEGDYTTRISQSTPVVPGSPTFSRDGRWLAYQVTPQTSDGSPSQLWIANADGTGAHEVAKLAVDWVVGWSPKADTLAVAGDPQNRHADFGSPTTLALVSPAGTVRRLLVLPPSYIGSIDSTAWSPDGAAVAVSLVNYNHAAETIIRAFPVNGAAPTTWLTRTTNQPIPGLCARCYSPIAHLAGWYHGWGIAFWSFAGGMVHNNDSTTLDVVTRPGATPRFLASTLSDGTTDALAGGPGDQLALVASTSNAGREYGQGKTVEHCDALTQACTPVPGGSMWTGPFRQPCISGLPCPYRHPAAGTPGSGVSLDPAWSPTAPLLAYVKAPFALIGGNPTVAWYTAHQLYLWNARTSSTRRIADIDGASVPSWSRDGRDLLYVSGDGLWLAPASGGKPVEIEQPLYPESQWNRQPVPGAISYYGQIAWNAQFSWWSP